ncbi:DNA replication/repair protein RecF [Rhodosalinus halophilus]|uniref:DNA replication and repair protein RecF n=1 Tax=Rhodosalinus halophilus TaxID=2259333 RepID=A0A365U852_9RHOB|nr:DNA replication/repair protein RecF [Rhodosalinus halophilus]RBI84604.1 DNA replication/repair protein RecF [Rhodosalinus halophilus]
MPGLYLSHLALSHFRSHRRAEVAADGRPIAIFGPNGAGKTNLLEAVSLFSPGRGMRRAAVQEMSRKPEALGWKVVGVLQSLGHAHEIEMRCEAGGARELRVDGKSAPQLALGRLARVIWLTPAMDRLWTEGADGRRRFLDRIALSFFPEHGEAALAYEKAMRERNRLLKEDLRDPAWYAALESQMARAGAAIAAGRRAALDRVEAAQAAAETAFPAAELGVRYPEEMPEVEEALATGLAEGRRRDLAAGRTLIGPHRADLAATYAEKGMPAAECSTGEQKALLISLVLANARALAGEIGAAPILLLDEVAAHLDAGRRAALYDEVCALGAQAWMTGTGPDLFEALGDRAQRIEVTEAGGESHLRPL